MLTKTATTTSATTTSATTTSATTTSATTTSAQVDKILGSGMYDRWVACHDSFVDEIKRAETFRSRLTMAWAKSMGIYLDADVAFAEQVETDYLDYLDRICVRGSASQADLARGEAILSVFNLSTTVLGYVNDTLSEMLRLGFVGLFTALERMNVMAEAIALRKQLTRLEQELKRAKRELREAELQTTLDVAIVVVGSFTGPLGWLALGSIGLGQMIADTYLGPATSDAATWGARGATSLGVVVAAPQKYLQANDATSTVRTKLGKKIAVVGLLFDANELWTGYSNITGLEALLKRVNRDNARILKILEIYRTTFAFLGQKLQELRGSVDKSGRGWIADTRATLEDEMRRTGYRPRV
jgi:hypothetical protein